MRLRLFPFVSLSGTYFHGRTIASTVTSRARMVPGFEVKCSNLLVDHSESLLAVKSI